MLTIIVTGMIGSGKSAVCALLSKRGIPVYDSDSRTKALYDTVIERRDNPQEKSYTCYLLDTGLDKILKKVGEECSETIPFVVLESAIILSKPIFDGIADYVVAVAASEEVRLSRLIERGLSEEDARRRMASQSLDLSKADAVIHNDGTLQSLSRRVSRVFFGKNSYICRLENK